MFTVCYTYLTMAHFCRHHRKEQAVLRALQMHGHFQSVAFRKILQGDEEGWGRKTMRASEVCDIQDEGVKFSHFSKYIEPTLGKQMVIVKPKQRVDLSKDWTSFIGSSVAPQDTTKAIKSRNEENGLYFLLEASPPEKDDDGKLMLRDISRDRAVKLSDLAVPVAWKPGEPFGILVQATAENFSKVGTAFMEGVLELDDGLYVDQIISVEVKGHPFHLVDPLVDKDVIFSLHTSNLDEDPGTEAGSDGVKSGRSNKKHSSQFTQKVEKHKKVPESKNAEDRTSGEDSSTSEQKFKMDSSQKPPNILIYTGDQPDAKAIFEKASRSLEGVIDRDKYVVYQLLHDQVLSNPWTENTVLLVLVGSGGHDWGKDYLDTVSRYVAVGGRLLNVGMKLTLDGAQYVGDANIQMNSQDAHYKAKNSVDGVHFKAPYFGGEIKVTSVASSCVLMSVKEEAVLVECQEDRGKVIHSKLPLVSLESVPDESARSSLQQILADVLVRLQIFCTSEWSLPPLTPCYLMGCTEAASLDFHQAVQPHLKTMTLSASPVSLCFTDDPEEAQKKVTAQLLTILSVLKSPSLSFDIEVYERNLKSKVLGNIVMYINTIPTTMTIFEGFLLKVPKSVGVVAVASIQTKGRGRGGNKWISPLGCAMFTSHVSVSVGTKLANKLTFVQHMAALAVVEAICTKPGYEDLDLKVKWPNDIYYGNKQKLGGILVNSSCMDHEFHCLVGIGFNVSNTKPTFCVNDAINELNQRKKTNVNTLTIEEVIAWTLTTLEEMVDDFQENGHLPFCKLYYNRWLHSDAVVHLEKEDGPEVTVIGLDGSGFLEVKTQEGKLISLQPDGNSFDMLKNLIAIKQR